MIRSNWMTTVAAAGMLLLGADGLMGYSLLGPHEKMIRQNTVAHEDRLEFAQTKTDMAQLIAQGELVALPGSMDYTTKGVSFPYARPEVLAFVQRLGAEYHASCGEPLVITSLARPIALQPRNASPLSVHPAGMAVDLHVPDNPACRTWLVNRLVALAGANVLDVTEEKHPRHLHVAVFPKAYALWDAKQPRILLAGSEEPAAGAASGNELVRNGHARGAFPSDFAASAATVGSTLALMLLVAVLSWSLARRAGRRGGLGPGAPQA